MEQNQNPTRRRRNRNRNRSQRAPNVTDPNIAPIPPVAPVTQQTNQRRRQNNTRRPLSIFYDLRFFPAGTDRANSERQLILERIRNNQYPDINGTDENGNTPLMVAVRLTYFEEGIVQAIVEHGNARIDAVNNDGETALIIATMFEKEDTAMYLINTGQSNPEHVDNQGNNALSYADMNDLYNVMNALNNLNTAPMPQQQTNQPLSIFDDLFNLDNLYDRDSGIQNIITRIRNNQYPDINDTDDNGNTPLICAIIETHFEDGIIQAIVEQGNARIGAVNDEGETALIRATALEDEETAMYLINTGQSNPEQVDNDGNIALHYAILGDLYDVMNALNNLNMAAAPAPEPEPEQQLIVPDTNININLTGFNSVTQERETIRNFLASDNDNVAFVVNNEIFFSNKNYIRTQLNNNTNNKYGCKQAGDQMRFQSDNNINFTPIYFTLSAIAPVQILVKKSEMESLLTNSNKLYVCYSTTRILPAIMSVAYYNGTTGGVSADHCQTGKATHVYSLTPGNLVDIPIDNAEEEAAAPVAQQAEQTVKVQYKGVTYAFPVTLETTLNNLKDMLLNKLVQENQIQTNNYNVKFIYTGKIYKDNDLNKQLTQLANPPFGITLQSMVSPISGGRKSKKYGRFNKRNKLTKRKKYLKHKKTFRRKRVFTKRRK